LTSFTSLKDGASSNMIPMVIDEYKPSSIKNVINIHNHLRSAYDGHESQRGRPDQTVVKYKMESPVVLSGESSPNEAAIRERMILCIFTKFKDEEYTKQMNYLKNHEDDVHRFGRLLLNKAMNLSLDTVENYYQEAIKICGERFPARVKNNLACMYAGIALLQYAISEMEIDWEEITGLSPFDMLDIIMDTMQENLLDGRATNMSVIDETFEIMARMRLVDGEDYIVRTEEDGRTILYLRLKVVYDRFTQYKASHYISGEVLAKGEFERQLKRSSYYIGSNKNVWFPLLKDGFKCWMIDFDLLSERCDVSGFYDADRPKATQFGIPTEDD
ncbi:MAG: hypothetical protein Q4C42_11850, partial [Clostridia bacterium]|nr:hypothetical protein [Clostridia bacterium]